MYELWDLHRLLNLMKFETTSLFNADNDTHFIKYCCWEDSVR